MTQAETELVVLASCMQTSKGVYALLLGSGISRSANIPTGWEITTNLAERLRIHLDESDSSHSVEEWYRQRFDTDLDYSRILNQLAPNPADRQSHLAEFFEDVPDSGLIRSEPTEAHHAIADLMASGVVRVVITTNFDRLLERALEQRNITPDIISSPDGIEGAPPLVHSKHTIIKVHGDYKDPRIRNTEWELGEYDPAMTRLMERVLEDFGLVICGWSGDYDDAMRQLILGASNRRYSLFWTHRRELKGHGKTLVDSRGGRTIEIDDADSFFVRLNRTIEALEEAHHERPSVETVKRLTKQYSVDAENRIKYRDFVLAEVRRVRHDMERLYDNSAQDDKTSQNALSLLTKIESMCEPIRAIAAIGCFYGDASTSELWTTSIKLLLTPDLATDHPWGQVRSTFRNYPAFQFLYSGGLAALAARNYELLNALTLQAQLPFHEHADAPTYPAIFETNPSAAFAPSQVFQTAFPRKRNYSIQAIFYLFEKRELLWKEIAELTMLHANELLGLIYRFEYILGLLTEYAGYPEPPQYRGSRIVHGHWLHRFDWNLPTAIEDLKREILSQEDRWPPLKYGLLLKSYEQFLPIQQRLDDRISSSITARMSI